MPAPAEREARLAQKLRANLARRKQQIRGREETVRSEGPSDEPGLPEPAEGKPAGLDRDDPPA
ncbi:MAG: hypothetical protein ACK4FK_05060 [Ferrovibrio sp.]|jgi:hypothetical protein|uniref:hypothetical protein n=1 Tax=Ferrovibrio sp. TaxID=1917215 RepID=UPI00391B8019